MSAEAMFLAVVADKGQRLSKSTELLNRLNVSTAVLLNLLDTIACSWVHREKTDSLAATSRVFCSCWRKGTC